MCVLSCYVSGCDLAGSSLSGNTLMSQASVLGIWAEVVLLCKCVYGTCPDSAQPLGAIQYLVLVHVGSQT